MRPELSTHRRGRLAPGSVLLLIVAALALAPRPAGARQTAGSAAAPPAAATASSAAGSGPAPSPATGSSADASQGTAAQAPTAGQATAPATAGQPPAGQAADQLPAAQGGTGQAPATSGSTGGSSSAPAPAAGPAPADQGKTAKSSGSSGTSSKKGKKGAAPAKPAPAPKPPPPPEKPPVRNRALDQLKPLLGTWACTGRTFGPGPEHATSATLAFAWQLDGFWLEMRYEEPRGVASMPVPVSAIGHWGFDALQQGLVTSEVDNLSGDATAAATPPGWQADKLVLQGTAHRYGVQFEARDTWGLHGGTQLTHLLEASVNGNWVKLHEDTCNRQPASAPAAGK